MPKKPEVDMYISCGFRYLVESWFAQSAAISYLTPATPLPPF